MLAIGATKAKNRNASKGVTSSRATRRRRAKALRSCCNSLLLKEPFIELLTQVLAVICPEDAVSLQTGVNMCCGQMVNHVFINQFHGGATWRAVGNVLEAGQCLGRGGKGHEIQSFLQLRCAFHN